MASLLTAELAAACNALGSLDKATGQYFLDDYTLDTVKDLIRYLRRDDEDHEIRRHLGQTKVLETDLVPILITHWEKAELFDVTLRLVVNLTNPPLLLYREEIPTEKGGRRCYLEMITQLVSYKANAFIKSDIWTVLGKRLAQILEMDQLERGEDLGLVIERILILIRNVLHIPADENEKRRPDNEAGIHDQVLWALNQSGLMDIILYMSVENEKQYFMHIMEIVSLALKEQNPSSLADSSLHRSVEEKLRDKEELCSIRESERTEKSDKIKKMLANRHSRFGGTYVVQNMKSISDFDLICHKPLSKVTSISFGSNKSRAKVPKNRRPAESIESSERRSAFAVRLFLKEFCIEFLNASYNPIMHHVRDTLVRSKAQKNDETYYVWAMKFFMEFNRKHNFQVKYVSETMSVSTFHYVQQQMERCYEMITSDKKTYMLWIKRLHLSLRAYQELLQTMLAMDTCSDQTVRESSKVIKSNIFYVLEYREFAYYIMSTYDETKMPRVFLKDLVETVHIFLKLLENYCKKNSLVVQKKSRNKSTNSKKKNAKPKSKAINNTQSDKEDKWEEVAGQLSVVLQSDAEITTDIVPFDATLDIGIDEQKGDCMKKIQSLLLGFHFEDAIGLIRAAREVWPENDIFGVSGTVPEEEFGVLRTIFMADIGVEIPDVQAQDAEELDNDEDGEDEEDENEGGATHIAEANFSFVDFINRFVNPKIVKACCLLLDQFDKNTSYTNHCTIKMMHRIAWDCKYAAMFFQACLFRTFQRIFASKLDHHKEIKKFSTFIMKKFVENAAINPKVYMELLFWKTTQDAYEIENGYDGNTHKSTKVASWSEEQENELRVLFMENQSNPSTEKDVIDWIQEMMIDQTKTRRGIIKKLKELGLIFKAPTRKSLHAAAKSNKPKVPVEFTSEEDDTLGRLWIQFCDNIDPLGAIIPQMGIKRPKQRFVERLLELGFISDKKECRKKRQKKSDSGNRDNADNSSGSDSEDSDNDATENNKKRTQKRKKTNNNKKQTPITSSVVAKSLISAVDEGFSEPLKWIMESLEEVALDQEAEGFDPDADGIPIVPIQSDCQIAMENSTFKSALKCLGIQPPADEQETYWRIPGNIHFESIRKRCETLSKAIDKTLIPPETPSADSEENPIITEVANEASSSSEEEMDNFFKKLSSFGQAQQENEPEIKNKTSKPKRKRLSSVNNESDSDDDIPKVLKRKKQSKSTERDDATNEISKISDDDSDVNVKKSMKQSKQSIIYSSDSDNDVSSSNVNTTKSKILSDSDNDSDAETNKETGDAHRSDSEKENLSLINNLESNDSVDMNKSINKKKRKFVLSDSDDD